MIKVTRVLLRTLIILTTIWIDYNVFSKLLFFNLRISFVLMFVILLFNFDDINIEDWYLPVFVGGVVNDLILPGSFIGTTSLSLLSSIIIIGKLKEQDYFNFVTLVIFGNVITAWSWFGTNMLGIGLHSYGFMDEAFKTRMWFAVGQVLFMITAIQPVSNWLSGESLAKGESHKRDIAIITAIMMGGGMMLHFVSFWAHDLVSYLGIAIVVAGLILSYVGGLFTSGDSTPRKKAA